MNEQNNIELRCKQILQLARSIKKEVHQKLKCAKKYFLL